MAVGDQNKLLSLLIKYKIRGRVAEFIHSRIPSSSHEIKLLLDNHFGVMQDSNSLIQDSQNMKQM